MQKSSQNLNDEMNMVPQPIRENEGGTDPGPRNVLSELTCAVTVDSEEAAMPIDAQPGPAQAVAPPQVIPGYLGRDRLYVDRIGDSRRARVRGVQLGFDHKPKHHLNPNDRSRDSEHIGYPITNPKRA